MKLNKPLTCYWLLAIACFLFKIFYLYRYFYYYHADTGWELYSIWAATKGPGHTDFLMSWRAGYLLNLPFMVLGFKLYYLRILYLCTWLASISLLVFGFDRQFMKNEIWPAALLIGMICPIFISDFILDYYTVPPIFLSLSLGLFLIGIRQGSLTYEKLFLSLSALCLSVASLANIGVLPAGILSAILISLYYRNKKALFFTAAYFIALGLLAYAYFDLFGVAKLLATPHLGLGAKVHFSWLETLNSELQVIKIVLILVLIGLACSGIMYYALKKRPERTLVHGFCIAGSLACLILFPYGLSFSYVLIYYLIYWFFMMGLSYLLFIKNDPSHRSSVSLILLLSLVFYFSHRTTSDNIFGSILLNYNSLMLIGLLPLIFSIKPDFFKHLGFVILVMGTFWVSFYANLHPISGAQVFLSVRYNTKLIPTLGVKADPETAQLIQAMQENYDSNHCQEKAFFSFYDSSLPYFLFKRLASFNQAWVSQDHFFPENLSFNSNSLIQMLNQSKHWCVIYSPTALGDGEPDNQAFLKEAAQYIKAHADKAIPLGYQANWLKTYTLYVKN